MPKQTFFNLSQSKQDRLVQAGYSEFSKHFLSEASVANIIKEAGIPRGSFYQYFEDINDLYLYLVDLKRKESQILQKEALEESDGDVEKLIQVYSKAYLDHVYQDEQVDFMKKVFLQRGYRIENYLEKGVLSLFKEGQQEVCAWTETNLKPELFSNQAEVLELFQFIDQILRQSLMEGFSKEWTKQETQDHFLKKANWLVKGIKKKEGMS